MIRHNPNHREIIEQARLLFNAKRVIYLADIGQYVPVPDDYTDNSGDSK